MGADRWPQRQIRRLGLVADSHGEADRTSIAVATLLDAGADLVLHLGDLGAGRSGELVVDRLVGLPVRILLGNVDDERLGDYACGLDLMVDEPAFRATVGGTRVAATHGHREDVLTTLLGDEPHVLIHGHTHRFRDETVDGVRVLNPGALHRSPRFTAANLDPVSGRLEVFEILDEGPARRIPARDLGEGAHR